MAISVGTTRQALANTYTGLGDRFSIHTASPGSTGANEATDGGYARKQTTWGTGAAGVKSGSQMTFDLPAGTFTHQGFWDTVPTFLDGSAITSTTLNIPGQILLTPTITIT